MKYKGLNKVYFGIGVEDHYASMAYYVFFFYWFRLVQKAPEGERLKRGRDYKGFLIEKRFRLPNFGIRI